MMDPIEFWSSQAAHPKPSSSAPPALSRRSGSMDRDDPLLSAPLTQMNVPEKNGSRQSRIAVLLKSPGYLLKQSGSNVDNKGENRGRTGPPPQATSSLASRAKKETPVPLPRQFITSTAPSAPSAPSVPAAAPAAVSKPAAPTPVPLPKPPISSSTPRATPTPVPLPKPFIKSSISEPAASPVSAPAPAPAPVPAPAPQPSAGRGRPKGWRPGMSYASLRGPDAGRLAAETAAARRTARQAKAKALPLGYAKRRGRPPKAPSPLPWEIYQTLQTSFAAFLCEWRGCKAELHNLDTLRRHVSVVHCRKAPLVCYWGKCAQAASSETFPNVPSLRAHVEKAHLVPFSWHVGDGPQNTSGPKKPVDDEEIPDYLKDDHGNQVTPSIRDQKVEDFVTWKNNRQKLKELLIRMNENLPSEESDTPNDED